MPKTAQLTKLDDRCRTAIWLGKSDRSDEHIIELEIGAVLERSVRRKVEGKPLKMVTGTLGILVPEKWWRDDGTSRELWWRETVRPKIAVVASRRVSNTQNDAGHDLNSFVQERRDQSSSQPRRGSQLHQIQQHRISSQRQRQHRRVESTRTSWSQRTLSLQHVPKPHRSDHLSREVTKQWNRRGQKAKDSVLWLVSCVSTEIPVSYVATIEIDDRPVYDHKTGERLSTHLVKVGGQIEHDAMTRHQLFECVPMAGGTQRRASSLFQEHMKGGSQRRRICSTQGMSPSLSLP